MAYFPVDLESLGISHYFGWAAWIFLAVLIAAVGFWIQLGAVRPKRRQAELDAVREEQLREYRQSKR